MTECRVVIVGGGISGLSAAFFLSRRAVQESLPVKITVLEASDRFGGVLRTLTRGDLRMEAGADAFYAGRNDATDLCRTLGLEKDLVSAAPCFRRFFTLSDKKPFTVPVSPDSCLSVVRFLSDPGLSFSAKWRVLGEPFIPRRKGERDESLASFIRRRLGEGFCQEIVKPLIQGVYMMDPECVSLEALFPRLRTGEKTYGSLAGSFLNSVFRKKEKDSAEFLTLKQGLERLAQALVRELKMCDLRKSTPVQRCAYHAGGGWEIFLEDGEVLHADSLGLAMNACDSSKLLSGAAPELSRELLNIRYDSIATVNLIYSPGDVPARELAPGFMVSMKGERYPFSSLKWLGQSADGKGLLLRAFLSEAMNPQIFRESDEMLKQKIRTFLSDSFDIQAQPLFINVERYPNALPQYETGHLERVAQIEKETLRYPGLFLTGNGFLGFGITDCIRQARMAASTLRLPA
ncbi:MAG: protoporphyrinogen oxidase [Candidatus Omnitrophica bacterium]|nr:protoporphyrinogen oxidase [Candidatus Omnitrophota bacterium]